MVTGASSGIGEAYAEHLAAAGWNLLVVARRIERLNQLAARLHDEHGVKVEVLGVDLGDAQQTRQLSDRLERTPLDMLVNNAGLAHYMPFAELPSERARELLEVNVCGPVLLTRAAIPGMIERRTGAIVNVASLLAFSGDARGSFLPQRAVYAATKSFLVTFTQILAQELEPSGVRIQVVCPGVVRSEFHTRQGMDLSEVPRMDPHDLVRASLQDLEAGVVVSIPGLADTEALAQVSAANGQLLGAARAKDLPPRYAGATRRAGA
jgi:short-subunit dehydrogenase